MLSLYEHPDGAEHSSCWVAAADQPDVAAELERRGWRATRRLMPSGTQPAAIDVEPIRMALAQHAARLEEHAEILRGHALALVPPKAARAPWWRRLFSRGAA